MQRDEARADTTDKPREATGGPAHLRLNGERRVWISCTDSPAQTHPGKQADARITPGLLPGPAARACCPGR